MKNPTPEFVSVNELAELLGVNRITIGKWKRAGKIPRPRKSGVLMLYNLADVLEAVRHNRLYVDELAKPIVYGN